MCCGIPCRPLSGSKSCLFCYYFISLGMATSSLSCLTVRKEGLLNVSSLSDSCVLCSFLQLFTLGSGMSTGSHVCPCPNRGRMK